MNQLSVSSYQQLKKAKNWQLKTGNW